VEWGYRPDANLDRHYNIGKEYKINPMTRQGKNLFANGPRISGVPAVLIGNSLLEKNPGIRFFLTNSPRDVIIPPQPTKSWKNIPGPLLWTT
jgi:hypothetical protein